MYVEEPDSDYFMGLLATATEPAVTSAIATVEMLTAIRRKEQSGEIRHADGVRALDRYHRDCDAGRIVLMPLGGDVTQRVGEILRRVRGRRGPLRIRSLDAIHLATALCLSATVFVSTDKQLRAATAMYELTLRP